MGRSYSADSIEVRNSHGQEWPRYLNLVLGFLGEIFIPLGNFDHQVARPIGHALATEARLHFQSGRIVQLIQFGVRRFIAGLEAFAHDDVARRAGADAAAGVIEAHAKSRSYVQDASRKTLASVGNFFWIHFDGFALVDKSAPTLNFFVAGVYLTCSI